MCRDSIRILLTDATVEYVVYSYWRMFTKRSRFIDLFGGDRDRTRSGAFSLGPTSFLETGGNHPSLDPPSSLPSPLAFEALQAALHLGCPPGTFEQSQHHDRAMVMQSSAPSLKQGRWIIHFDYDAFYASVVEHENPALKAVPLM